LSAKSTGRLPACRGSETRISTLRDYSSASCLQRLRLGFLLVELTARSESGSRDPVFTVGAAGIPLNIAKGGVHSS